MSVFQKGVKDFYGSWLSGSGSWLVRVMNHFVYRCVLVHTHIFITERNKIFLIAEHYANEHEFFLSLWNSVMSRLGLLSNFKSFPHFMLSLPTLNGSKCYVSSTGVKNYHCKHIRILLLAQCQLFSLFIRRIFERTKLDVCLAHTYFFS